MRVDRDVPVPPPRDDETASIRSMRVGDSVLFDDRAEAHRFAQRLYRATLGTRHRQLSRKTEDGWRVWKVRR